MTHSTPREFTITFKGVSSAQANQLAEELRGLLQREIGNAAEIKRHKEDPDALDEGGTLVILLGTVAMSIHDPKTMSEALLTAMLVDFAYRHSVELQIEDRVGNAIRFAKDTSLSLLEDIKGRFLKFFQKDNHNNP